MKQATMIITVLGLMGISLPVFGQSGGLWLHYDISAPDFEADTVVTGFAFDGSTTVWAAAPSGIAKFDGTAWSLDSDSVIPSDINAIAYARGSLWLGSSEGLAKFDGTNWTTYTADNSQLISTTVYAITADAANTLWIGTSGGLSTFTSSEDWTSYTSANVPVYPSDQVLSISINHQGAAWLGFYSGSGMVKFNTSNPLKAEYVSDTITDFPTDEFQSVYTDENGAVWAGSQSNGLVWTDNMTARYWSKSIDPNWISDNVDAVTKDQCGNIWIGTDHGAAMYDGTSWIWHTVHTHELLSDVVYAVAVDPMGHIWFGTDKGITEFKPYPEKPVLSWPLNAETIATDSITCRWDWDCPNVQKYWYEIADNANFTNSIIDTVSTSLTQSAAKLENLLTNHTTYYWRVRAKNDAGWGPYSDVWSFSVNVANTVFATEALPDATLAQNTPNPWTGTTTISFSVGKHELVTLHIYDILGRSITTPVDRELDAGNYSLTLHSSDTRGSGTYIISLQAGTTNLVRLMQVE